MTRAFCVLSASLVVAASSFAIAAVSSSQPVSDRDGYSNGSLTGPFTLRPDGLGSLIVGMGFDSNTYHWRSGMEFDIAAISGTVTSATLSYTFSVVQNGPAAYQIHGYVGDGSVSAADLAVSNVITPVLTSPNTFPPPTTTDVTGYIKGLVNQHRAYAGFTFSGFAGGRGFAMVSSEPHVTPPTLNITYTVPEPVSAGALLSLVMLGRRTRKTR